MNSASANSGATRLCPSVMSPCIVSDFIVTGSASDLAIASICSLSQLGSSLTAWSTVPASFSVPSASCPIPSSSWVAPVAS